MNGERERRKFVPLEPPEAFAVVEPDLYRSSSPLEKNFPFLLQLQPPLKTVVFLSPEAPSKIFRTFLETHHIGFIHQGLKNWKPSVEWRAVSEEMVKEALEKIVDKRWRPLAIMCTSGVHESGAVVGCLRRLQNWALVAILNEYYMFAGGRARLSDQHFVERFDTDLVTLPAPSHWPEWLIQAREIDSEEQRDLAELAKRERKLARSGSTSHVGPHKHSNKDKSKRKKKKKEQSRERGEREEQLKTVEFLRNINSSAASLLVSKDVVFDKDKSLASADDD
eukprot:g2223.t1